MMMRANTRFLLVTQCYTVLELSLFILSGTVRPTVIAETKLRACIYMLAHEEKPGSAPRLCAESSPLLHLPVFRLL